MVWTVEECPTCLGSGFRYCERCENTCEHDRPCPTCHGYEKIARRQEGIAEIAVGLAGVNCYRTRREAEACIREERCGAPVTVLIRREEE